MRALAVLLLIGGCGTMSGCLLAPLAVVGSALGSIGTAATVGTATVTATTVATAETASVATAPAVAAGETVVAGGTQASQATVQTARAQTAPVKEPARQVESQAHAQVNRDAQAGGRTGERSARAAQRSGPVADSGVARQSSGGGYASQSFGPFHQEAGPGGVSQSGPGFHQEVNTVPILATAAAVAVLARSREPAVASCRIRCDDAGQFSVGCPAGQQPRCQCESRPYARCQLPPKVAETIPR
jgi:hypothetical protein